MRSVLMRGLLAGTVGTAAMTIGEKLEQGVTRRPNSYVPAHTLEGLLGMKHGPDQDRRWLNWAMHWGQGALLGIIRAALGQRGINGPYGSFLFWNLRLLTDHSLENATGVGKPPWDYSTGEQVVDIGHKGVYAFATGLVADALQDPTGPRR